MPHPPQSYRLLQPNMLESLSESAYLAGRMPIHRRVEDGRGGLGHAALPRFPSPLIKPDVRIARIRLSDWFHRAAHGGAPNAVRAAEAASAGRRAQQHRSASVFAAGSSFFRSVRIRRGVPGSSPITDPRLRPKRTRSKGPFLRQHYPASTVVWRSPTPVRPAACASWGLPAPVETGLPR